MSYFILSLDGGGIRGLLTARLLQRLESAHRFLGRIDLIAGTSTGGILALGLAKGLSPTDLVGLYRDKGRDIFSSRDLIDRLSGGSDELFRANYSQGPLREALEPHFEDLTLGDLTKRVLIPTFDLDNEAIEPNERHWKPKFFHNYETSGNDRAEPVLDTALRTTAAPTYFESHQGFVDGGVVANNPATCAVAKAVKAGIPIADIVLLSVGTGFNPHTATGGDWGHKQWLPKLLPMLMDGMPGVAHYQCKQFLGERYHRLDATLPEVIDLDQVQHIDTLLELGNLRDIGPTLDWMRDRGLGPIR